jgi:hypothetical protein
VDAGNVSYRSSYFDGDLEASGYLLGDGTFITNLPYVTGPTNLTLDDVATNGNIVTASGAYFNDDLEAAGYLIGNGSLISNLPLNGLQNVTTSGASTTHKVNFTDGITSLSCNGNIVALGNITSSHLIGNGEFMGGVANVYELSQLESNITTLESNIMITNTSTLTSVQTGDILVSTTNSNLGKLAIGSIQQLLYANITTSQPEWKNLTDIFDAESRLTDVENSNIFISTPNLTSVTTGDILYGYGTGDLRRLAPQTTADNTYLTIGDYGTGFGRLLRMDEHGDNAMWLHPTSNLDYEYNSGLSYVMSYIPLFDDELNNGSHLRIKNRSYDETTTITDRIRIGSNYFDIKFGQGMFYDQAGVRYMDTNGYSGNGSTWHPDDIKFHWYVQGNLKISGSYHGDGSLIFTGFTFTPSKSISTPSSGLTTFGKDGQLLTYNNGYFLGYSDRRLKTKIETISNALDKLAKITPKLYDKEGKRGSGLIAQDVYYNAKELRHMVWPDRDAKPNDDAPEPDYSDWGKRPACIRYPHLVAYIVKSIHELRGRIETLKNNKV